MVTCQKWLVALVSLQLLVVGTFAIPSPGNSSPKQPAPEDASDVTVQLDSDTGDDRELKSDDDGYDFLSIDQLFLNNPQYRQLISDLQAHTFGSNWRRKRDVSENELPEAFRTDESVSSPRASTVPTTTTTSAASSTTSVSSASSSSTEALVSDVQSTRDISASTTSDQPKAAALTSTSSSKSKESPKEVTKPSTVASTSVTGSSSSSSTTTSTATSTAVRGSSTVATSAAYGSSGSTEVPGAARNTTLEMTTAAAPIRASTPRRLSHKNGSNKNKNKLSAAAAQAAQAASKPTPTAAVGPSTVNVNKVSVSSNAVASSSSSQLTQQTPPAVAIPAPENGTAAGPAAGNNKDK
uniref:Uncharacterized protein n=1 Tax=Anopheles dirus TaxID=7168 RepID=A0A182N654_9DIPT